jgi:hypothetical protein
MLYQLIFILALANQATATLYYVESAPVAPFSCTITHPCRVSDLPSTYTTADTVYFVPATTGVSSTFTNVGKTFRSPSLQLLPGIIFSNSGITAKPSPLVNCTGVSFLANSLLSLITVDSALITNTNFTASTVTASANSGSIKFVGCVISGLSGVQAFAMQGNDIRMNTVRVQSSTSSHAIILFQTGNAMSQFVLNHVVFDTVTTTSGSYTVAFVSNLGNGFALTVIDVAYNAVVADGALMEWDVSPTFSTVTFYQNINIDGFNVVGGSCKNGWMYANNNDNNGVLITNIANSRTDGVNFNGGPAWLSNSNPGLITINANDLFSNDICTPTNHPNLAECRGTFVNAAFFFSGQDEGSLTLLNCPTSYISPGSGMTCP